MGGKIGLLLYFIYFKHGVCVINSIRMLSSKKRRNNDRIVVSQSNKEYWMRSKLEWGLPYRKQIYLTELKVKRCGDTFPRWRLSVRAKPLI